MFKFWIPNPIFHEIDNLFEVKYYPKKKKSFCFWEINGILMDLDYSVFLLLLVVFDLEENYSFVDHITIFTFLFGNKIK